VPLKVTVIGAGIVGCLTAIKLKESGYDVTLIDKNEIGKESSWAGAGILFPLMPWDYESRVFELCTSAADFYEKFSLRLFKITGIDSEFIESGLVCIDPRGSENILNWAKNNNLNINECSFLDQPSYLFPRVTQIRPPRLMKAIKLFMQEIGINIRENTTLIKPRKESHNIKSWSTTENEKIKADIFVITSGAWTSNLVTDYNDIIFPVRGQMIQYEKIEVNIKHVLYSDDFYVLQRKDGVILAGSTVEHVGFDKNTDKTALNELMKKTSILIPELKGIMPKNHWAGIRPGSKGNIPVIKKAENYENIFINSGHYRYGLTMAPKSAEELYKVISESIG